MDRVRQFEKQPTPANLEQHMMEPVSFSLFAVDESHETVAPMSFSSGAKCFTRNLSPTGGHRRNLLQDGNAIIGPNKGQVLDLRHRKLLMEIVLQPTTTRGKSQYASPSDMRPPTPVRPKQISRG
eukprot:6208991-Pleurochrysis_carterae.AAC.1